MYTKDHFWVQELKNNSVKIGLSDYAQDSYGDFVHVEIEQINTDVVKDGKFKN